MKPFIFFSLLAITYVSACKPAANNDKKSDINTDANALVGNPISLKDAKRLVKNYEQRAYRPGQAGDSLLLIRDTRCVWFDINTLKTLVDSVKNNGGDGIRFYLAAYDKDSTNLCQKNYRTLSTLVLISTIPGKIYPDTQTKHIDWYYNKPNNGRIGAMLTATPENHGELCPPPSSCASEGATLLD